MIDGHPLQTTKDSLDLKGFIQALKSVVSLTNCAEKDFLMTAAQGFDKVLMGQHHRDFGLLIYIFKVLVKTMLQ